MRFSVVLAAAPILLAGLASAVSDSDITECMPAAAALKRRLTDADYGLEARAPGKASVATAIAFVKYLKDNSATLTKAPVFWTGKIGRKGAKQVADKLKKDAKVSGETVFDVLARSKIQSTGWQPGTDWREVCGAFAKYSQPTGKKAFLVYGTEVDQTNNIWTTDEWPELQKNAKISEVVAHKMKADGTTWEAGAEIKASKKGSPV